MRRMDTDTARAAILAQIRARRGRPAGMREQELRDVEFEIGRHQRGPQPSVPADVVAAFIAQATALQTSVARVAGQGDVPQAVAGYLREQDLAMRGVAWAALDGLPWSAAGVTLEFRPPVDADKLGITGCFCAVAETGSLVLASSQATPASTHLLPETHVAIVPATRIVPTLEDAYALLRTELGELPRALSTVSGPSRTGDIEQTIVLGAHGPYRVHVVIVDAA